jgi:hypothetical protein
VGGVSPHERWSDGAHHPAHGPHRFALDDYREALLVAKEKGRNKAVKAVFAFPPTC